MAQTLILDATTKTLKVKMSGAPATTNPDFVASWADNNGTTFTEGSTDGALNGTSDVTLVGAPASSVRRVVKSISIENRDSAAVTLTVMYDNNSTQRNIVKVTLAVGDTWTTDGTYDTNGQLKTISSSGSGDMILASVQSVTGKKTFDATKLAIKGSSTGVTTFDSANAGASDYTQTFKAATGTVALTSDITGTNSGTNTGDQTSIVGITGTMAQFDTAVSDGNIVYQSQALGTPSSGTGTNLTGIPLTGLVSDTTTALGIGSINLGHASDTTIARSGAGAITVEGVQVVLANTSPTLATITTTGNIELGNASDTTISRTGAGAIAVEGVGVALNSTSLVHTASTIELGAASDTTLSRSAAGVLAVEGVVIPSISSTNTLTNKRKQPRAYSAANNASLTPEIDTYDIFHLTAMSANTTINNHSTSTPADGELMEFRFLDNATPRTLTWGSAYVAKAGVALPTTTTTSKNLTVLFEYNSNLAKWNCMATGLEA